METWAAVACNRRPFYFGHNDNTTTSYSIFKSMMISRRLGGGNEAYYTYVEAADNDANKDST